MISASFDSTKTPLQELLAGADKGLLQLPDFQRGWVWDDDHILSLIASVSVSFPIGVEVETYDEGPEEWDIEEPIDETAS